MLKRVEQKLYFSKLHINGVVCSITPLKIIKSLHQTVVSKAVPLPKISKHLWHAWLFHCSLPKNPENGVTWFMCLGLYCVPGLTFKTSCSFFLTDHAYLILQSHSICHFYIPWKNFFCSQFPAKTYCTLSISIHHIIKVKHK